MQYTTQSSTMSAVCVIVLTSTEYLLSSKNMFGFYGTEFAVLGKFHQKAFHNFLWITGKILNSANFLFIETLFLFS